MTIHATADLHPALAADAVTSMLRQSPHLDDSAGLRVQSVTAEPVGAGQMARSFRLHLEYECAPAAAPATVVAKIPSSDEASLAMAAVASAYRREVLFYRNLGASLGDAVPLCHYGVVEDNDTEFVLLLEDLAPATVVDQRADGSPDQAAAVLDRVADLHGTFWGKADASWLPVDHVWGALAGQIPTISEAWLGRFGGFLDAEQSRVIQRLGSATTAWLQTLRAPRTVWHGDLRLDNILFEARGGDSAAVLVDWQSTASGPGTTDVTYFLGTTFDTALRHVHERDLVREYHRRLTSFDAVNAYSFDDCWRDYRMQALYALVLTVPVSMGVQSTERGDAMFGAMAARAARHVLELDTFEALDELE